MTLMNNEIIINKSFSSKQEREEADIKKIKEISEEIMNDRLNRLFPLRFKKVKTSDIPESVNEKLKSLNEKGLYLFGSVGTGKTHLGYSILRKIIEDDYSNAIVSVDKEYADYKIKRDEEMKKLGTDELVRKNFMVFNPAVRKITRCALSNFAKMLQIIKNSYDEDSQQISAEDFNNDILIIDDLGVEKFTDWSIENLYQLVDMRYKKMLPTIFISNLSLKDLSSKVGDRITSRIAEMSEIIRFAGKDRRLEK